VSLDEVTRLLRRGDPGLVEADLVDLLVSGEGEWLKDERNLMMALAPLSRLRATVGRRRPRAVRPSGSGRSTEHARNGRGVRPAHRRMAAGIRLPRPGDARRPSLRMGGTVRQETVEQLRRAGFLDEDHFE